MTSMIAGRALVLTHSKDMHISYTRDSSQRCRLTVAFDRYGIVTCCFKFFSNDGHQNPQIPCKGMADDGYVIAIVCDRWSKGVLDVERLQWGVSKHPLVVE